MNMKLLTTFALLLLVSAPAFGQQSSTPQKRKFLIGNPGVSGPVHIIRDERTSFEENDGQLIEGPRILVATLEISEDELKQERTVYRPEGQVVLRSVNVYSPEGLLQETTSLNPAGVLTTRTVYAYGDDKRMTERVTYNKNGAVMNRATFRRDDKQAQSESLTYDSNGNVIGGASSTNDLKTRQAQATTFNSRGSVNIESSFVGNRDGSSEFKETRSDGTFKHEVFKPAGNGQNLRITYNPDGTVLKTERMTHEFDSYGNIVKTTVMVAKGDSQEFQPASVNYRTFTYYEKH
jgi:antitoxin component YwqK of YwqJK toxin-antitoxin module